MKNMMVLTLAIFTSLQAFSTGLLPADHSMCVDDTVMTLCSEGTEFYKDQDGRCGCLSSRNVIPVERCTLAFIQCRDGKTFSSLYQTHNMCGMIYDVQVGCGCFSTIDVGDDDGMSIEEI